MTLAILWLPFVLLGMAVGVGIHHPAGQAHVERCGMRVDRFWVVGLLFGVLGPLLLVLYGIERAQRHLREWLTEPADISLPGHLRTLGAATPEDVDQFVREVKAGARPCFIPDHPCGICGKHVNHSDLPTCPDPGAHDVCKGLHETLDAMTQEERDLMVCAMRRAAERRSTEAELAAALTRAAP